MYEFNDDNFDDDDFYDDDPRNKWDEKTEEAVANMEETINNTSWNFCGMKTLELYGYAFNNNNTLQWFNYRCENCKSCYALPFLSIEKLVSLKHFKLD